ncbi:MAG: hypothetical protein WAW13_00470 [Minisyncoccia bacterium]
MGAIVNQSDEAFRDYVTDGVPASGAHEPIKSDIRAIFPYIETADNAIALAGSITVKYALLSSLNADLAHIADTLAIVYNDGTNNGIYYKIGGSGSGSWALASGFSAATGAMPEFVVASGAPVSGDGSDGDYYIDTDDGSLYGPKDSTGSPIWPDTGYSLMGPTGATGAASYVVTTSYANEGGQGDRTALFRSREAGFHQSGTASSLIDGDDTNDATHSVYVTGSVTSAKYAEWRAQQGSRYVIDEFAVRHATARAANGAQGTWKFQAKQFGEAAWTDVTAATELNPPNTSGTGDANVLQIIAATRQYTNGQVKGFDLYRMVGVSGTGTALDANRLVEVEFKIGTAADHLVKTVPSGGSADYVLTKADSDTAGPLYWAAKDSDTQATGLRYAKQQEQNARRAERRSRARYFIDGTNGSDTYTGESSITAKATIGGLIKRLALTKGSFSKTGGYTYVYQYTLDKSTVASVYPKGSELAVAYSTSGNTEPQWFDKVASLAELDAATGPAMYIAPSEAGAKTQTVYIKAVSGGNPVSDTNSYSVVLAPPKSAFVAFRAGTTDISASFETPNGFTWVGAYGEGSLPHIDCGRTLVGANWTLSTEAAVGGGANTTVFEVAVTMEANLRYLNDQRFMLTETDATGKVWPAIQAASLAAVATNPGQVWWGDPTTPATQARSALSARMFYRPRYSTNPTGAGDGKTYRVAARKAGISIIQNTAAFEGATGDGQEIEGIRSSLALDGHGAILSNTDATVRRCLVSWGSKHAFIIKSGRWEDCIAFGGYRGSSSDQDFFAFTFYAPEALAIDAVMEGSGVVFPDHYKCGTASLYAHGSTSNSPLTATMRRCFTYNAGAWQPLARGLTSWEDILSRELETYRGVYANLAALTADTGASDGEFGLVTSDATVGNRKFYRWNAAIVTPAWESAEWANGQIGLPLPTATHPNKTGFVNRALLKSGTRDLIVLASAGGTTNRSAAMTVRNSVLHKLRGPTAGACISLNRACKPIVENNFFVTNVDGTSAVYLNEATVGSTFRHNIIYDLHTASDGATLIEYAVDGGVGGTNISQDYNVYCMPLGGTRVLKVGGTNYTISSKTTFATYQAAMVSRGLTIDANSVWLDAEDCKNLFVGDPALGDYRLRKGTLYAADGTALTFVDGSPINSGAHMAGPLEHMNWNSRQILEGAPGALPIPPKTEANCELYCRAPWLWDWYAGETTIPSELR